MREKYLVIGIIILLVAMAIPAVAGGENDDVSRGNDTRVETVDVPTWYPGDTWWYFESHDSTSDQPSTQHIETNSNRTVLEITTTTVNANTYTCYKVDLSAQFAGYGSAGAPPTPFTVWGTITGEEYYRVNDLAKVKVDTVEVAHITMGITIDETTTKTETWEPPDENYDFPIKVGESWTLANTWKASGTSTMSGAFSYQEPQNANSNCPLTETKQAGGTDYSTFKVVATGQDSSSWTRWYNETVGNMVYEYITNRKVPASGTVTINTAYTELKSYTRINQATIVNQTLPATMDYGYTFPVSGKVTNRASGLGIPNKDVTITVPKVAGTFTGKTNANGLFTIDVEAPTEDDATPTTYDKGSYGILTRVASPDCWIVDTLTLGDLPSADLRLRDQDITNDTGGMDGYVGQNINISAEVYNVGTQDATGVNVKFYDGTTYLGEDTIPSIVASSGKQSAVYQWTPDTEGDHEIIVKVNEGQTVFESDYGNNDASMWIKVVRPFGINITCSEKAKNVKRGNDVDYSFTVKNIGILDDNVELTEYGLPAFFQMEFDEEIVPLTGGAQATIGGTVSFPYETEGDITHKFQVNATSKGDTSLVDIVYLSLHIDKELGVEMWTTQAEKGSFPGKAVSFNIAVNNTGNVEDTYVFSYGNLLSNWIATVVPNQLTLDGYGTNNITLTVTPDSNAELGTIQTIQFSATSNDQSTVVAYLTIKVTILEVVDLDVSVLPLSKDVDPGKDADYTISIENKGNGDKTLDFTITSTPPLPDDFDVDFANFAKVAPTETKDVELTISAPATAKAETYTINISAKPQGVNIYYNESVTLEVNPAYGLELKTISKLSWDVAPNSEMNLSFEVENLGNTDDIIDVELIGLPSGWTSATDVPTDEVELLYEGTYLVTFTITTLDVEGTYEFDVKVTSRGDADAKDSKTFSVTISGEAPPQDDDVDDDVDDDRVDPKSDSITLWVVIIVFIILAFFLILIIVVLVMKKKQQPGETTVIVEPAPTPVHVAEAEQAAPVQPKEDSQVVEQPEQIEEPPVEDLPVEEEPELPMEEPPQLEEGMPMEEQGEPDLEVEIPGEEAPPDLEGAGVELQESGENPP